MEKSNGAAAPGEPQSGSERAMEIGCRARIELVGYLLRNLRAPEVNVKRFDLVDQQEDCLAGRAELLALGTGKARAPVTELIDLVFVQTLAQRALPFLEP